MTENRARAAEELFHRTLNMMTRDTKSIITPEMKQKMTSSSLKWMGVCGVLYTVIVITILFLASALLTVPTVHESSGFIVHASLVGYFMLAVCINLVQVIRKPSFYAGPMCEENHKHLNMGRPVDGVLTMDEAIQRVNSFGAKSCPDCNHWMARHVHHCVLCRRCISKRDHHCFFTGCCVGADNQKYFILFAWYVTAACLYVLYVAWQYLAIAHGHPAEYGYYHLVLPLVVVEFLLGYASFGYMCCVFMLALCLVTSFGTGCVFGWQIFMAATAQTTYEFKRKGGLTSFKPSQVNFGRNLYDVFGPCWWLNFFIPVMFLVTCAPTCKHVLPSKDGLKSM